MLPTAQIPSITIEGIGEDSSSIDGPTTPNTAGLLSPLSQRSNAGHSDDTSSLNHPPPSPTLSARSSVHFDSLALRDNKPEESRHLHRHSNATFASVSTVPDLNPTLLGQHHTTDSLGTTIGGGSGLSGKKQGKKDRVEKQETRTAHELELEQDRGTDSSPFSFRPYQLAHMLGSKSFLTLESLGGTQGLLRGLGTRANAGLSANALATNSGAVEHHNQAVAAEKASAAAEKKVGKGAGPGGSQRHDRGDEAKVYPDVKTDEEAAINGSVDDRRRVYGPNILPTRPSKTLLQLMWMALKDKVLILLCIAAVISLALGLFQDFGTKREPDDAPVDWVEGVAIMVAVSIVVSKLSTYRSTTGAVDHYFQVVVGSLNDWQKERQFKILNDKKEERGVKVIRDGVERVIDIKVTSRTTPFPLPS